VGTSMGIAELDNISFFIKKTEKDFQNKKNKIDELIFKNKIILKDQTRNAKEVVLKFLNND
jgi:uncharacterized protein (DUF1919 family)